MPLGSLSAFSPMAGVGGTYEIPIRGKAMHKATHLKNKHPKAGVKHSVIPMDCLLVNELNFFSMSY